MKRLEYGFYNRPCLDVARDLIGKILVYKNSEETVRMRISETEAYCGEADTACHAHKGRTNRTEVLYRDAGTIYVYLCYGIHWLLNIVTGDIDDPQAVLIRCCVEAPGPGRLTKAMGITGGLNRKSVVSGTELWVEDDGKRFAVQTCRRVGIGYASQEDQQKLWRFVMGPETGRTV